jgi:hypothetical protein
VQQATDNDFAKMHQVYDFPLASHDQTQLPAAIIFKTL